MFHSASFGVAPQKTHDVIEEALHNWKQCERIIRETYEGFFTEQELDSMLQGKTFWMDAEEFSQRFERRNELLEAEMKASAGNTDEAECTGDCVGCGCRPE